MKNQTDPTSVLQAPHWVDKLATGIINWQTKKNIPKLHVDDMKTPSGRVHTGSLVGVVLHDVVAKTLADKKNTTNTTEANNTVTSTYVFNDMDSMDGLPTYLDQSEYSQHMGKPLYQIPTPPLEKSGISSKNLSETDRTELEQAKNLAELYALDFIQALRKLGCSQTIVWSHELYQSGKMDTVIREALDNVEKFKTIYQEIADYKLPEKWYPFQVICPQCGKLGTTLVTDWDGTEVTFECQLHKVAWAEGCGHTGKISPFGGTGKLLWKVDWPAHWKILGVTIEGAGKDHTSSGGSRDMANTICQQIFHIPVPFDIPYEWILIRGTKMSSSKGIGTSAREFTELFPAEIGRFLFVHKQYNQVLDFDPEGMTIPDLFDTYDQAARIFWQQETGDERLGRTFELSQITTLSEPYFLPRFRDIAVWMQYPEKDLFSEFVQVKGSALTDQEKAVITERQQFARLWIDRYAPEEFQFTPRSTCPKVAHQLTAEQKNFLAAAVSLVENKTWDDPQELQQALFDKAKNSLGAKAAFQSIYLAFLGKKSGPRAAWFLLSIKPELRKLRLQEIKD